MSTTERPEVSEPRSRYVYYPGTLEVPEAVAVNVRGRSYKIAADVDLTVDASGVIFAHGAQFGGHALYIKDGKLKYVYDYLGEAALMDLRDLEHNTRDGVHIASLAGAWIALVGGFGGLRHRDGTVSFAPRLPQALSRLSFSILIRGRRLRVEATHTAATYYIADGKPLDILHYGEEVQLSPGHPKVRPIEAAPAGPRPSQPPGREPVARRRTTEDGG